MINIHQLFFNEGQRSRLDSAFIPYDNSKNSNPEFYEFGPMLDIYRSGRYYDADYTGVVSYKFNTKTKGVTGEQFIRFVAENPGYDAYFINPHPYLVYCYYNVWDQGKCWHNGLKEAADIILKKMGITSSIDEVPRHTLDTTCYANFWIGNQKFWSKYGKVMENLSNLIQQDHAIHEMLFSDTFHANSTAPLFPFFFERLFSTIISLDKTLSTLPFPRNKQDILDSCFYEYEIFELSQSMDIVDKLDRENKEDELRSFFDQKSHFFCEKTKNLLQSTDMPSFLL